VSARCVVTARCHVEIRSFRGRINTCQESYVKLNGTLIFYTASYCNSTIADTPGVWRGFHTHLIDPFACSMIEAKHFDTWAKSADDAALRDYLDGLDDFAVITGHMLDDAVLRLNVTHDALLRLGIDLKGLNSLDTFAFVTQKSTNEKILRTEPKDVSVENPANLSVMITGM